MKLIPGKITSNRVYSIEIKKGEEVIGHCFWKKDLNSWVFVSKVALTPLTMIELGTEMQLQNMKTITSLENTRPKTEYTLAVGSVKKVKKGKK